MRCPVAAALLALMIAAPACAAEVKGPALISGTGHEDRSDTREALADAGQDLASAQTAVDETARDFARIEGGDWSGTMTIDGDRIIKCGDPAEYPELDCAPYSEAEMAEMRADMAEDLAEARADLAEAEADLKAAENAARQGRYSPVTECHPKGVI